MTIVALDCVFVLVLVALALSIPSASEWISAAAQAEFAGSEAPAAAPMQIAGPPEQLRLVTSD
jgi:hypothetical protein